MSAQFYQMDSVTNCATTRRDPTTVTVGRDTVSFGNIFAKVYTEIILDCKLSGVLDVDECDEMSDKCNKTESAPATCINNEGSYRCSCDQRTGYVLSSDGKSCQGMIIFI